MDDWGTIATAGPIGVLFIVLTMLVIRLASHLSADRGSQLKQIAELRERHNKELADKDAALATMVEQVDIWRKRAWENEYDAERWRRQAKPDDHTT